MMINGRSEAEVAVNVRLLHVGSEVFPVYGSDQAGWALQAGEIFPETPAPYRYGSLDEIFFALVNLNVSPEGRA